MTEKDEKQNIDKLRSLLYCKVETTDDVSKLRQCIEHCDKKKIQSWIDSKGYDILHHAILAHSIEAVEILFALGLFKPPHQAKKHSYIHVAANLGIRAIVALLLQERPGDSPYTKTIYTWIKDPTEVPQSSRTSTSKASALDVAGDCGNTNCVETILHFSARHNRVNNASDNNLSLACVNNSPSALRLLLKQKPQTEDVKSAVGSALKLANAECLDVLLRCNPGLKSLFSGMNLYHVLYSYSLSFKKEWYESLLTVTTVLLEHKQNPVSNVPFRTYPLYSLLSHVPASDFARSSPYLIACIMILLNAGVDPNLDEVSFEKEHDSYHIQTAFGRDAYSSAFHCLFDSVGTYLKRFPDDASSIKRYLNKCIELLLKHNADINIYGSFGEMNIEGNTLHAFAKMALSLKVDERSLTTFHLLMQNGTDPNTCASGKYPINVLCDEILVDAKALEKLSKRDESIVVESMSEMVDTLLYNMAPSNVKSAFNVEFAGKPTNELQKNLFKMIKESLSKKSTSIFSLKALCRLVILQCCDRKPTAVIRLPLLTTLKKYVNGIDV